MSDMSERFAEFRVSMDGIGRAKVVVNGEDVSQKVRSGAAVWNAMDVPKLQLEMDSVNGGITGVGIVEVYTQGLSVGQVLAMIDPKELEAVALKKQEFGENRSFIELVLETIAEMADAFES